MTSVIMAIVTAVHDHEGEVTGVVQRTELPANMEHERDGVERGATRLLGIEGLDDVEFALEDAVAGVVHVVTGDGRAAACPSCGVLSSSMKGRAATHPRDIPYGPDPVLVVWHKRRWALPRTPLSRASFTEPLPGEPARARVTTRLHQQCGAGIAEGSPPCPAALPATASACRHARRGWAHDPVTGRWSLVNDRWHTAIVEADRSAGLLAHIDVPPLRR